MPDTPDRGGERLHLLWLAKLLPNEVPINQPLVVYADGDEERVLDGAVHEGVDDDAQDAILGHAGLPGARPAALEEELHVVAGLQALVHVCVQDGFVDEVLAAQYRIHTAFYEERTQTSQQGAASKFFS